MASSYELGKTTQIASKPNFLVCKNMWKGKWYWMYVMYTSILELTLSLVSTVRGLDWNSNYKIELAKETSSEYRRYPSHCASSDFRHHTTSETTNLDDQRHPGCCLLSSKSWEGIGGPVIISLLTLYFLPTQVNGQILSRLQKKQFN